MNNWDRNNLNFLLSTDPKVLEDWYQQVGDDDIRYALELLQMARAELEVREHELMDAEELDTTQAQTVLARFRL